MTNTTQATLGTWTNGTKTLKASYLDEEHVRIDTQDGSTVITTGEWLARLELMKETGARKA